MNAHELSDWVLSKRPIDLEQVHPEDREAFDRYLAHDMNAGWGAVMARLSSEAGMARVRYRDYEFRMPEGLLDPLNVVPIDFFTRVEVTKSGEPRIGVVEEVGYHYKQGCCVYYLSFDGKRHKRRYLESDFFRVIPSGSVG